MCLVVSVRLRLAQTVMWLLMMDSEGDSFTNYTVI